MNEASWTVLRHLFTLLSSSILRKKTTRGHEGMIIHLMRPLATICARLQRRRPPKQRENNQNDAGRDEGRRARSRLIFVWDELRRLDEVAAECVAATARGSMVSNVGLPKSQRPFS